MQLLEVTIERPDVNRILRDRRAGVGVQLGKLAEDNFVLDIDIDRFDIIVQRATPQADSFELFHHLLPHGSVQRLAEVRLRTEPAEVHLMIRL